MRRRPLFLVASSEKEKKPRMVACASSRKRRSSSPAAGMPVMRLITAFGIGFAKVSIRSIVPLACRSGAAKRSTVSRTCAS